MRIETLRCAIESLDEIQSRLAGRRVAVFLDYDGTLTPIVPNPDRALLDEATREAVRRLATRCPVAIVSGRDRTDVAGLVDLPELTYAGSHGFDIAGPAGSDCRLEIGAECAELVDQVERRLRDELADIAQFRVDRKRYSLALHYRRVAELEIPRLTAAVDAIVSRNPQLRKRQYKMVYELQPNVDWHKGRAVHWLLERLCPGDPTPLPIYLGDDITDEDALASVAECGIGIVVADHGQTTSAHYRLHDTSAVRTFLAALAETV